MAAWGYESYLLELKVSLTSLSFSSLGTTKQPKKKLELLR